MEIGILLFVALMVVGRVRSRRSWDSDDRGCRKRRRERRERFREARWRRRHKWTKADDAAWEGRWARGRNPKPVSAPVPAQPSIAIREDRVAHLQNRWVKGLITDGDYEKQLDLVYGRHAGHST